MSKRSSPSDGDRAESTGKKRKLCDTSLSETAQKELSEGQKVNGQANVLVQPLSMQSEVSSGLRFDELKWGDKQDRALNSRLLRQLTFLKFETATKIQAQAILQLASNERPTDAMLRSQTGSGKTLAFLLPALNRLLEFESEKRSSIVKQGLMKKAEHASVISRTLGTRIIIISPTRELALQTESVVKRLTQVFPWITTLALVGGAKRKSEKASLRKGAVCLLATPGRILDHLGATSSFKSNYLMTLILDEADRLLDLGFESKLKKLVHELKERLGPSKPRPAKRTLVDAIPNKDMLIAERAAQHELLLALQSGRISQEELRLTPEGTSTGAELEDEAAETVMQSTAPTDFEQFEKSLNEFQVIVASATLTPAVEGLAKFCLKSNHIVIDSDGHIARLGASAETTIKWDVPSTLKQAYININSVKQRLLCLFVLLKMRVASKKKTLVFLNGCKEVDFFHALCETLRWPNPPDIVDKRSRELRRQHTEIRQNAQNMLMDVDNFLFGETIDGTNVNPKKDLFGSKLVLEGVACFKLHGSMGKYDRQGNLDEFTSSEKCCVLFTTDVAARGLNLPAVDLVIQITPPLEVCDYVHRIGRTARMGHPGTSVLFLLSHEVEYVNVLKSHNLCVHDIKEETQEHLLQVLLPITAKRSSHVSFLPASLRGLREKDTLNYLTSRFCLFVEDNPTLIQLAREAYQAHVESYHVHGKDTRHCFDVSKLHLGHIAGSFFLRGSPNEIARHLSASPSNAAIDRFAGAKQPQLSQRPIQRERPRAPKHTSTGSLHQKRSYSTKRKPS